MLHAGIGSVTLASIVGQTSCFSPSLGLGQYNISIVRQCFQPLEYYSFELNSM